MFFIIQLRGCSIKYFSIAVILVSCLCSAFSPSAYSDSQLCRLAYVETLRLHGEFLDPELKIKPDNSAPPDNLDGFYPNLCLRDDSILPKHIVKALTQIKKLNQKVAGFFGLTAEELFTVEKGRVLGIDLRFIASEVGNLRSYAIESFHVDLGTTDWNRYTIALGVFPDWKHYEGFGAGTYIHELSHVLVRRTSMHLPKILSIFGTTGNLFDETHADTLALALEGREFFRSPGLPECMDRVRFFADLQSYNYPLSYFDNDFFGRRLVKCCQHLTKHNSNDEHVRMACGKVSEENAGGFPEFRRKLFDPLLYVADPDGFDTHQIGIPINSFIAELSDTTGQSISSFFPRALDLASKSKKRRFFCSLPNPISKVHPIEVSVYSYLDILKEIKNLMPNDQKIHFDNLWQKHALEKAVTLAKYDDLVRATSEAAITIDGITTGKTEHPKSETYRSFSNCKENVVSYFDAISDLRNEKEHVSELDSPCIASCLPVR